jgi:hypothetical protein
MTGPEFAAAHGNDSSTWTSADFEAELNLAEIDAHVLIGGLSNAGKTASALAVQNAVADTAA